MPAKLAAAQLLLENMSDEAFVASKLMGYRMAECCSNYGGVKQRWLIVESEARKEADLKRLSSEAANELCIPIKLLDSVILRGYVSPLGELELHFNLREFNLL
jgi:hypothetical protein